MRRLYSLLWAPVPRLTRQPLTRNLMLHNAWQLDHTTQLLHLCRWQVLNCFLAPTCMECTSSDSRHGSGLPLSPIHRLIALRKFKRHAAVTESPSMPCPRLRKRLCFIAPWLPALRRHLISCLSWTFPAPLLDPPPDRITRLRQPCSARLNSNATSGDQLRGERQMCLDKSADIASRRFFPSSAVQVVPPDLYCSHLVQGTMYFATLPQRRR